MKGISVLTLVKNRAAHLAQLVEGLCRSEMQPDELVIVDMDDPPPPLAPAAFQVRRERLAGASLPLAQARNLAAGVARFDHLLFLDVDCIPMAGLVGAMAAQLTARDAVICAEILYLAANEARGTWTEDDLRSTAARHPVRDFPLSGLEICENPGLFWSLAFGIRRATFMALGGFDEIFTGYGAEDTDFGFRARRRNMPLALLGGAGIGAFHQHHPVFDPPLQHFADIVRNATLFHARWNMWPMQGWLDVFAQMRLIEIDGDRIEVLRPPEAEELRSAMSNDRRF